MHSLSIKQACEQLECQREGLSSDEAKNRLKKYGKNELPKAREKITRTKIFLGQFASPLIIILIIAGLISGMLGEAIDMTVIFITVGVNTIVGFIQEDKANQALKKLSQMIEYKALVSRDNKKIRISGKDVVPGDIMMLEAGDKIQADARIISANEFFVNESALTGESEPQQKNDKKIKAGTMLADRTDMVYRGTIVSNGRATVLVVTTGANTEIGKIASLVKETKDERTPLQIQLAQMGKVIGIIVVFISVAIFTLGMLSNSKHHTFVEMFETAVAIAVAAIPEGLVISMTVILAIGMQFILKRKALARKLVAAETLGSVSVICTDKTGTLTEGNMNVTRIVTARQTVDGQELRSDIADYPDVALALKVGILANNAVLENPRDEEQDWRFAGDTTDVAFLRAGQRCGFEKRALDTSFVRVGEVPFDSNKKFIATLHHIDHESVIYIKGAAEKLYSRCKYVEHDGKAQKFYKKQLDWFKEKEQEMTRQGLRVIAVCYRRFDELLKNISSKDINGLVFVGLVALSDPLRKDVRETIGIAQRAGIRVIMITGDHVETARSIARQIDIPFQKENTFDGERLEDISDEELARALESVSVFARVDPKHKIRIVQALQKQGEIVAMTGDGVNDAPALKAADIGVAVGSGTDVAKEIADLVLLDDNFNTIVAAVQEGRGIYQNIKKVILYLLSGSFAEVILIAGSLIAGFPLAVAAVQILWVNLIEDSFPNMALAFDKGDKENMKEPPRRKDEGIIDREMKVMIAIISIVSNFILLGIFYYFWKTTNDIALTRTIVFVGLGIDSLLYIYSVRSMRHHVWQLSLFDNHYLTAAVLFGWAMLLGAVYVPGLQYLLKTVSLSWQYWVVLGLFGLLNVGLIEMVKGMFFVRRKV